MLQQLTIQNFAVVASLTLDWHAGMTTITGETGAGKSIALDALSLCMGARAEAGMVRSGAAKTDISASFDVRRQPEAVLWLQQQDLVSDDASECIIRRTITKDGRSRGYINGHPVPAHQLKALGGMLINIHGQHAHLDLLKSERQQELLDNFADNHNAQAKVASTYKQWQQTLKQLKTAQNQQESLRDRLQLLRYQVNELNEFNPEQGEFEQLELEFKRLSNAVELMTTCHNSQQLLSAAEPENVMTMLHQVQQLLATAGEVDASLKPTLALLEEARIQLDEAGNELDTFATNLASDPERLNQVEQRLQKTLDLARKHQIQPEQLAAHHHQLSQELSQLDDPEMQLEQLQQLVEQTELEYHNAAQALSKRRRHAGKKLAIAIVDEVKQMNMPYTKIEFSVTPAKPSSQGSDSIQLLVSTNPGQAPGELAKVASGGELSRIGLAIQVVTHHSQITPTLIFDEVDVGISGPTASVVGRMLKSLGDQSQVICVTHLPQVAANGHQQLFVDKLIEQSVTETRVTLLDKKSRIHELARLLGGEQITERTLANAQELLLEA
ncbi:DNA repair protein RecN [Neiella marina]|uniref:DNA repair protein RecN n=1 Tax=Neiella holothuriorum TaxID=2870530 RepID=A0ABS7EGE5_9GAMM|nr:DNA repair protein RecN [Neiella holothuriorum]MBW8191417.1 DNA repair protein RecN [Neiella holothuriorum]